jgi:hypothetical protein
MVLGTAFSFVEAIQYAEDERGLILEIQVYRAVGDACLFRHITHSSPLEALFGEDRRGGVENLITPGGDKLRLNRVVNFGHYMLHE